MADFSFYDLFTEEDLEKAERIHGECAPGEFAKRCAAEVIEPILGRINEKTGQENDARYLAYMMEHALNTVSPPGM